MAQERVAVVGLGYVGIPLSALLASKGYDVVGIDLLKDRADWINRGKLPLKGEEPGLEEMLSKVVKKGKLRATSSFEDISSKSVVFVCVDTPILPDKKPDYSKLQSAVTSIAKHMRKGTLVIVESTLAPGTMLGVVANTLSRESGLQLGKGFKLAHCPERVMPGRLLHNITTYDRVIGGYDKQSVDRAKAIYSKLTKGKLHSTDLTTAEIVKTAENAYRDVQIAFANEVALISEKLGADAFEVRRLVNTCPFRDMHIPGAGVGGHCLPKDPWLLIQGGSEASPKLIPMARSVNEAMPFHVLDLAAAALERAGKRVEESTVVVMGASFLQESGDIRNSPSVPVIESMKCAKDLRVHDPYVDEIADLKVTRDVKKALEGADLAIFMVAHKEYQKITPGTLKKLMRTPVVVDGRNIFSSQKMRKGGVIYRGVGKGVSRTSP